MLVAKDLEVRAGARLLLDRASFQIAAGDKIGLVGRNGAGKTTLTKILAGEGQPAAGIVTRAGQVGYLPQDPRTGDLDAAGQGPDPVGPRPGPGAGPAATGPAPTWATRTTTSASRRCTSTPGPRPSSPRPGGYAAEAEAARIASNLALPDRVLHQPLRTLSGGQRRRVELARILFSGADTLLLDEPTNHLDADSIVWLRSFLQGYSGGILVISHDAGLLEATVTKVFHLDANRAELDIYAMDWKRYLQQRETDEKRRKRERANAERKADQLMAQADKMRAKATKATAAQNMARRAERLLAGLEAERAADRVAKIRFPEPAPCGKTPLTADGPLEVVRVAGGVHRRRSGDRQGQPGGRARPERRGQDHAAADPGRPRAVRHR